MEKEVNLLTIIGQKQVLVELLQQRNTDLEALVAELQSRVEELQSRLEPEQGQD